MAKGNMAQQKLYTEEQVRTIIGKAQILNWDDEFLFSEDYLISSITPIELPSDEEIIKIASQETNNVNEQIAFNNGAIHVCKLIEQQILNK